MNKNFKVITINGIRGLITVIFAIFGLISGFIISPGWVCMKLWNYFFEQSNVIAQMNIYQGIMLWAIIALSLYALNNKRALIGFGSYQGLSPEQINDIMTRAKNAEEQAFNELKNINSSEFGCSQENKTAKQSENCPQEINNIDDKQNLTAAHLKANCRQNSHLSEDDTGLNVQEKR